MLEFMVLPMIPRKYNNYLMYKFVLGFYTNTIKLYIKYNPLIS